MAAKRNTKPIATKQTKAQAVTQIAEDTGLSRKQVAAVLDVLGSIAQRHLKKGGSGEFTVPGVGVKLRRVTKPAQKARTGKNPFTGEEMKFKAKPAQNKIRATALKALKDAIN